MLVTQTKYGPMEERREDFALLNALGLLQQLDVFAHDPQRQLRCTYMDATYPVRARLLSPFQGSVLNGNQITFKMLNLKAW